MDVRLLAGALLAILLVSAYLTGYTSSTFVDGLDHNYYVRLVVQSSDPGLPAQFGPFDFSGADPSLYDIRVTDTSGNVLPYTVHRYSYFVDGSGNLFVQVPFIPAGGTVDLYIDTTHPSDPTKQIFPFFEDFSGTSSLWSNCTLTYTTVDGMSVAEVGSGCTVATSGAWGRENVAFWHVKYLTAPTTSDNFYGFLCQDNYCNKGYRFSFSQPGTKLYMLDNSGFHTLASTSATPQAGWSLFFVGSYGSYVSGGVFGSYTLEGVDTTYSSGKFDFHNNSGVVYLDYFVVLDSSSLKVRVDSVEDLGGVYRVTLSSLSSDDMYNVVVPISSSDVPLSPFQHVSVFPYDPRSGIYLLFDPTGMSEGDEVFIFYGGPADNDETFIPADMIGSWSFVVDSPSEVTPYSGSVSVSVSPESQDPGTYTVSASVSSSSPYGVSRSICDLEYNTPVTHQSLSQHSDVTGPDHSFSVDLTEEGVYVFSLSCHSFLTAYPEYAFTHIIYVPDPSVPDLSISVFTDPSTLSGETNVTVFVTTSSDGTPVQSACYLSYLGAVYEFNTSTDGTGTVEFTAYPDTSFTVSCDSSSTHPSSTSVHLSSTTPGGGTGGGGGGGAAPAPSEEVTPEENVPQEVNATPASPLSAAPASFPNLIFFVIFIGVITYFLIASSKG